MDVCTAKCELLGHEARKRAAVSKHLRLSIGSDSWVAEAVSEAVSKPGLWSQQQQPLSADPGQPREGQGRHCRARSKGTIVEGEPWNPLMGCLKCS